MSTNLESLIRGRSNPASFVQSTELSGALARRATEKSEQVTESLVDLIDNFICVAERAAKAKDDAVKAAEEATAYDVDVRAALNHFGSQNNPLPFFRVTHQVQAGRDWCAQNKLDVPSIQDTSSAWFIQA